MYIFIMESYPRVSRTEFQILAGLYSMAEKIICPFLAIWIVLSIPNWTQTALQSLKGEWVDVAFSDVLSERYGCQVTVKNVHFDNWSLIRFESLRVCSFEGKPLIYGSAGSFQLWRAELWKMMIFETEVQLKNVRFTKEYYKDNPALKKWSSWMKRPIAMEKLDLRVIQCPNRTLLGIIRCESKDIALEGGLLIDSTGKIENKIRAYISPWTLVRSLF